MASPSDRYGVFVMQTARTHVEKKLDKLHSLVPANAGKTFWLRGRIHSFRIEGNRAIFLLRQRQWDVQVVVTQSDTISKEMIDFIGSSTPESVVDMEGKLENIGYIIPDITQFNVQMILSQFWLISTSHHELPLQIKDASRRDGEGGKPPLNLESRLDNRILDLRSTTNQCLFRLQGVICTFFRQFMSSNGFLEIHTPKIVSAPSEGFGTVFTIPYFKKKAYLAQSPQLYKQMAISADFDRVYSIGSVFRAENEDTHRHLTEFVCLDFEMAFEYHYHEVIEMVDKLFVHIFQKLADNFSEEAAVIHIQYPCEPFKFLPKSLVLRFDDGIKMLNDAGVNIKDTEDLSMENEKLLGVLVKAKYDTDFFILDKFPLAARPFYTMPDMKNKKWSNSFDVYMRGEEIVTGAQRIHEPDFLIERANECGIDLDEIKGYIDSFRYGGLPHAGAGIGLERMTMLYLGIDNIRKVSMFPRDTKRMFP